jgi:hypothetical protein
MFGSFWRDQVGSIADRGREILRLATGKREPEPEELARRLLAQRGEASGLALAQDLARLIRGMTPEALTQFLQVLGIEHRRLERVQEPGCFVCRSAEEDDG